MAWVGRQLPEREEVFLDHIGWFVGDLDRAAAALRRLGFLVSDENVHMNRAADGSSAPSGTRNRLATLALGYLEFLAASGDTPLARQHGRQLARYEGLHLMAFSSADVPSEASRLEAEGFTPHAPVDMRRHLRIDGAAAEARFDVLRVPPGVMAEGRVQWCGHRTPALVWRDGMTDQPNGALALTGALWTVADLPEALDRYSRFVRKPATRLDGDVGRIELDRGALLLATPAGAAGLLPEFAAPTPPFGSAAWLACADLDRTAACLDEAAVGYKEAAGGLVVAPADALGAWLVFHPAANPPEILGCG